MLSFFPSISRSVTFFINTMFVVCFDPGLRGRPQMIKHSPRDPSTLGPPKKENKNIKPTLDLEDTKKLAGSHL